MTNDDVDQTPVETSSPAAATSGRAASAGRHPAEGPESSFLSEAEQLARLRRENLALRLESLRAILRPKLGKGGVEAAVVLYTKLAENTATAADFERFCAAMPDLNLAKARMPGRLDPQTVVDRTTPGSGPDARLHREALRLLRTRGYTPQSDGWETQYTETIARLRAGGQE